MKFNDPYSVVLTRRVTEKAQTLQELETNSSNPCVRACKSPKVVFVVHPEANKLQIAAAVESIYADKGIKVQKVNTVLTKGKRRRVRGRIGFRPAIKKAIVTLSVGDKIDNE